MRRLERREAEVRDRFGLLLLLIAGAFVALGFSSGVAARVLASVLQVGALLVAFAVTDLRGDRAKLAAVGAIGAIAIVLSSLSGDVPEGVAATANIVVVLAVLIAVLERVLRHRRVTLQTLYGAVCAYFLLGLMFSSLYTAFDLLGNEPLFGESVSRSVYSYFSFTTLTTVGFGDYSADTDLGRRVVVIEAIVGQVFIATTLARLVSLYRSPSE